MKIIDDNLLNKVSSQAKASPRLRMNYNFHQSLEDKCHRFLNAVEPGTKVEIHRHPTKDESFVLLRGKVRVTTYNDDGTVIESVILCPDEGLYGVDIPKGVWHNVESLESRSVFFECKEGPFVPHEVEGVMTVKGSRLMVNGLILVHDSRLKFNCLELSRMMAISLKSNLSIPGTKFDHLHTFDCGNTVAVYDVTTMYGLNQIIGHAKFNNKEYGEVLYRGETKLHSGLIPSLFRKCTGTTRWDQVSPLVNKILQSEEIKFAMNAGVDHKMARHKVEGMLQHYGIQTRFIDLVDNHWVALWMGLHKCCETKKIQHYYHYERRRIPIVELATGASVNDEDLYQYILMLALPKSNNAPIDGIELTDEFVKVDLRQALPSVFLRPHSQHGLVARKKVNPSKYAKDYDMASQVIGILRIRIDYVDQWLGNGQLLSQDNLFPNAMNDYGYDLLLQLPDDFIPKNFAIAKYV